MLLVCAVVGGLECIAVLQLERCRRHVGSSRLHNALAGLDRDVRGHDDAVHELFQLLCAAAGTDETPG